VFQEYKMSIVNASEMVISHDPQAILEAPAIGSGIGVAVYDPKAQAGGIIHFLLPNSTDADAEKVASWPYTFADTGVRLFLEQIYAAGLQKDNLQITVAGGAQPINPSGFLNMGQRNYEALKKVLGEQGLIITRTEIGGHAARSMRLAIGTGQIQLETRGQGVRAV
jgi:chemotaxis protein CheD